MKYFLPLLMLACTKGKQVSPQDPIPSNRLLEVEAKQLSLLEEAQTSITVNNPLSSWLTPYSCDGMEHSGKAAAGGLLPFDPDESSYGEGRYGRRPFPDCFVDGEDQGAKTTWSRDMAVAGLFPYLWRSRDLGKAEEHAKYGVSHGWKMGEPTDDYRVYYTPQVIGLLYQMIYALGGENNGNRFWPTFYPDNLEGYQVELLLMSIWLRGETDSITDTMLSRIRHYASKDQDNILAWTLYGVYTGDFGHSIDLCLSETVPEYMKCSRECILSELIFSCDLIIRSYK